MSSAQSPTPTASNPLGDYIATQYALSDSAQTAFSAHLAALLEQREQGHTLLHHSQDLHANLAQYPSLTISEEQAKAGEVAPIVLGERCSWLYRLWASEHQVAQWLYHRLTHHSQPLNQEEIKPYLNTLNPQQKQAVLKALTQPLTLINGGPGTGKTYTVARIVQAYLNQHPQARLQLSAPTGKAANRMTQTLTQNLPQTLTEQLPPAQTLHRLLGIRTHKSPRYHAQNPLDLDLLIIDEASMLSLELTQQLLNALAPKTTLILLGDAHQLAAVEAGAILHDLSQTPQLNPFIATLTQSTRFDKHSLIGQLADATLNNQPQILLNLLAQHNSHHRPKTHNISQIQSLYQQLFHPYQPYLNALNQTPTAPNNDQIQPLFAQFDHYRILCAGHAGVLGTHTINQQMRHYHQQSLKQPQSTNIPYYHGQPILIQTNTPQLNLYNGDIGLCLINAHGEANLYFPNHSTPIAASYLNNKHLSDAYALSIHKSQGSEFTHIAICLDTAQQRLISRELLYTAITRAKESLSLYSDDSQLIHALNTPTQRQTGLAQQLQTLIKR
ncbi:exodeoxyribonuclease V subunit alpha [Rappaport israeli]|uniref:exodeoxyribonuclease V subunit alpha n=1 Tax=Rappaport israeli TaxID=1839807 RepID=UPI0009301167|nr:exodeoxyribonuclease V subunit alpha [Rappaport israeli]